jgi:hypothetical protein
MSMDAFCLGYTHRKCDSCQHEKNWKTLNQLPDALRKTMQASMRRIDSDACRLTGMGEWEEPK